jgi:hypothetical protein
LRGQIHRTLEALFAAAHAQGTLRTDFAVPDVAPLLWSFGPLIDAGLSPDARRRHLHWMLDGLRPSAATAQTAPPMSQADLELAVGRLRTEGRRRS